MSQSAVQKPSQKPQTASNAGVEAIQGTLNHHGYHSILQRYAIPSGLRLVGLSFVFQQDNDPTHLQVV